MATLRNHQLKVYNKFDGGVQNVPADHLIAESAFTYAINDNVSDSTLRPQRGDVKIDSITVDSTVDEVIKENVKGDDTLLQFQETIKFINYADTVYYIENRNGDGSPLMQVTTDGNADYVEALPVLSGDVTVNTSTPSAGDAFNGMLNTIYNCFAVDFKPPYLPQLNYYAENYNPNPAEYTNNALIREIQRSFENFLLHDAITNDNVSIIASQKTTEKQVIVDSITTTVTEMAGTLTARINGLSRSDVHLRNFQALSGYSFMKPNFTMDDIGLGYCLSHIVYAYATYTDMMDKVIAESATKYVMVNMTEANSSFIGTWNRLAKVTLDSMSKILKSYNDYINSGNTLETFEDMYINSDTADNSNTRYVNDVALTIMDRDELHRTLNALHLLGFQPMGMDRYIESEVTRLNTGHTSFGAIEYIYSTLRNALTDLRTCLESHSIQVDIVEGISQYGIVGYNSSTYATTNMLTTDTIYDKEGVTLTWDATDGADKYLIYYHDDDGLWIEIADTTDSTINLTPPYVLGAVATYPYRIKEPHTDYTSIVEYKGVIFLNRKNSQEVFFTLPNNPHAMKATSYIKMPQDVKAMKSAGAGVFIWTTNNSMYLLTGSSLDPTTGQNTLAIKLIGEGVDVISENAVTSKDNLVVWLSDYAIHNTSGFGSADTTTDTWTPPDIVSVEQSLVYHSDVHFLVKLKDGTKHLIVYDTRRQQVKDTEVDVDRLSIIDSKLVGLKEDGVYEMFASNTTLRVYNVGLKRYAGYSYDTRLRFTNVVIAHDASPYGKYVEGASTVIRIYVDNFLVGEEMLTETDATRVDLPNTNNTGMSIRIEFEGTLQIKSVRIRYTTHDWED